MNNLTFLLLLIVPMIFVDSKPGSKNEDLRNHLIGVIMDEAEKEGRARCWCRIGDDRGDEVKEYNNPMHDFGAIKHYSGLFPQTDSNDNDCGRICSERAFQWASKMSNDQLCKYLKKKGSNKIVAYAKVGTKKWSVRQTLRVVNCCVSGGNVSCPSGWEYDSNPKKCKKHVCEVASKGYNGVLKDKNGNEWGFIYDDHIYQMIMPKIIPLTYYSCN